MTPLKNGCHIQYAHLLIFTKNLNASQEIHPEFARIPTLSIRLDQNCTDKTKYLLEKEQKKKV